WKTRQYPTCPVLFRTVLEVGTRPVEFAAFQARASGFAYVFLDGKQIAAQTQEGDPTPTDAFSVLLMPPPTPGKHVLIVSTRAEGFSLDGGIGYRDGRVQRFGTDTRSWKVQKLPPLTMLEYEPCMQPDFDGADWSSVRESDGAPVQLSDLKLRELHSSLGWEHLERLDEDARWRLQMLADKGIAIVDWEARGWGGAERLPDWVRQGARFSGLQGPPPGQLHFRAQALTRYVLLSDEATNLGNLAKGLEALEAPAGDAKACREAARAMRAALAGVQKAIADNAHGRALAALEQAQAATEEAREGRLLNELNRCLDSKFGWFDNNELLDNDIGNWGLRIASAAETLASPLSPAALVTLRERELTIEGWDELEPLRVYNKPARLGPVCLWAVLDGKVTSLQPGEDGVVYDRVANGALSENWVLLVEDLARGGRLPIELVFLRAPDRIVFRASDKGTSGVTATFDEPGARLFVLRPLKEWRGFLGQARTMTAVPLKESDAQQYIEQCRFWSRALLNYPITFSEAFVRDPEDKWALMVADVYNYLELEDEWDTEPIQTAPLPPLATYGLMRDYPGLKVISDTQTVGSRGIWGDSIAAVGQDHIVYRVPLDPIKRFGGFTSYCFGPTDIGEPGSIKEIETIKRTGSNTFRPQHNQTGERAMKNVQWSWEQGIQNVFNTDEKWVPDVVEHFRKLAEQCRDYPPDAIAYDLLNEPETRDPRAYNALIRKITAAIREIDQTHLIYVEVIPPWGPGAKPYPRGAFESLEPTGDPLTCYSFHDYEYRLPPRWPNEEHDTRTLLSRWIPAFRFAIDNRCAIHLGEFGGFEQTEQSVYDNACALTLMTDYLNIFDQFGWHWHYYANRGVVRVRKDGSLQESYVQDAYRRYFASGRFNAHRQP
ncbi:MAG: glycoside hydrolase family 5 protein, partial [Armatimonadota bacterium]